MVYLKLAEHFTLSDFSYAHRGLWTPKGPAENSLAACLAAANAGYGIEFDVRPSAEGVPMVFHDKTLERMTDQTGAFEDRGSRELISMQLPDGSQIITLDMLLDAWPGKTPLLCEMKIDGATGPADFAREVGRSLARHSGPAAAMSFDPRAVTALPKGLMRGQLVDAKKRTTKAKFEKALKAITAKNADYIACHTSDAKTVAAAGTEKALPVIVWTTQDAKTYKRLKPIVAAQIFEGFIPEVETSRAARDM